MYQSINFYINQEPQAQAATEAKAAYGISQRQARNQKVLLQNIPALTPLLQSTPARYELIVNANQNLNICLKSAGAVLYGQQPEDEINKTVQQFLQTLSAPPQLNSVLVISGIGLGHHMLPLVQHLTPSYVLIYEPEPDLLLLSLKATTWFELLTLCQTRGIHLFLQIGENARNLLTDLKELREAFPLAGEPVFYQHLSYPELDQAIYRYKTGQTSSCSAQSPVFLASEFLGGKLANSVVPGNFIPNTTEQLCFAENLKWLANHTPELSKELTHHSWQQWQLCKHDGYYGMQDSCGRIYSVSYNKANRGKPSHHPALLDPIVFDYSLPDKLLSTDFATLFTGMKNVQQHLLSQSSQFTVSVRERILLGTADYQTCIEALVNTHYLIVLEPDPDFLLASMFVVPWHQFKGRLYFCRTIDDIETLVQQLFQQQILNLTDVFLDHPYYEQSLRQSYHSLLELIQSSNGKANYFEKQLDSIKHLYQNQASARYLTRSTLSNSAPIFIIGNGPSLDSHITFLQQHRRQFILVSCGTALITLYRNGLTPDYHLELERGADTLYYLQQIPSEYFQQLTLISPADQHPAVIAVFQEALLVLLSKSDITDLFYKNFEHNHLQQLTHSYYTVTNFAVDLFLSIGCQSLYLLGIDFGFKHIKAHHASNSVYFQDNGTELYDFERTHGAAYEVEANFGGNCLTVPPFDIARKLMAERINLAQQQKVYNCSDGAHIEGAIPLLQLTLNNGYKEVEQYHQTMKCLFTTLVVPGQHKEFLFPLRKQASTYLQRLLDAWEHDCNVNLELAIMTQRKLLESTKDDSQLTVYMLLDGALRYLEMVSSRLHLCNIDSKSTTQLAELWQRYLTQSLGRVE